MLKQYHAYLNGRKFRTPYTLYLHVLVTHTVGLVIGGTAPPTPKLACFVLYLKTINTFLKTNICILL